jgi:hypothetical protein
MGVMGIMGGMGVCGDNGAGVAEQAAEDVGEEVREQGGFLEIVRAPGGDEAGPVQEFGLPGLHALRQGEAPHLLAHPTSNFHHRTAGRSHPKATSKPPQSLLIAN